MINSFRPGYVSSLACSLFPLFSLFSREGKLHFYFCCNKFPTANSFPPYQWRKGNGRSPCLAEDKTSVLLHLTNTSCPAQGPTYLLFQIPASRREPQEIFIGRMRDDGLSSVASSGWQGAHRPYLIGVMELSPCLIKGPRVTSVIVLAGSVLRNGWNLCIIIILM